MKSECECERVCVRERVRVVLSSLALKAVKIDVIRSACFFMPLRTSACVSMRLRTSSCVFMRLRR